MADTVYTDYNTAITINSSWLNDINNVVYRLLGTSTGVGGAAPTTVAQIQANLGIATPTNVAAAIAAAFASPAALGSTTPAAVNGTTGNFSGNVSTAILTPTAVVGRTTAPTTGQIGELLTSSGTVAMTTTNVAQSVTSLALTAGVWDVEGQIVYTNSAAGANQFEAGVNTVNNTLPASPLYGFLQIISTASSAFIPAPKTRYLGGQTVYLVGQATFTGTSSANYFLRAVRVA